MENLFFFFLLFNINIIITFKNNIISFKLGSFKDSNIDKNISTIIYNIKK